MTTKIGTAINMPPKPPLTVVEEIFFIYSMTPCITYLVLLLFGLPTISIMSNHYIHFNTAWWQHVAEGISKIHIQNGYIYGKLMPSLIS
jgi:hypothetical protein